VTDGTGERGDRLRRRLEGATVTPILDVDVDARGSAEIGGRDRRLGRVEAGVRCDDEHTAVEGGRRTGERAGVRQLAAKVEAAQEGEDLPERYAARGAQPLREGKARA